MKISEITKFIGRYVKNPSQVGAVCPSSKFLARRMVGGIDKCKCKKNQKSVVVELGAGTGAVTRVLVKSGCDSDKNVLYSIEFDVALAEHLRNNFPTVKIVQDSAENLRKIIGGDLENLVAVISSLPLLSLPKELVEKILREVEVSLPVGGVFVQFTYNLARSPKALNFKNMKHVKRSIVLLNVPPARVDVFEKIA